MPTEALQALVVTSDSAPPFLLARTLRALAFVGIPVEIVTTAELPAKLRNARAPLWILRAGACPTLAPRMPPRSATGLPLLAIGATLGDVDWERTLSATGGDLTRVRASAMRIDSVFVEAPADFAKAIEGRVASSPDVLSAACAVLVARGEVRGLRIAALDVTFQARMHVFEVVTTLHRGGAERVVLDLVTELRRLGHDVTLAVLDRSTRTTFEPPEGTLFVHELAKDRRGRIEALVELVRVSGADVVHAHLLDGDEIHALGASGVPVVMTVHNSKAGWPARLDAIAPGDVDLFLGCSRAVSNELSAAFGDRAPVRTVWNGIQPSVVGEDMQDARERLRSSLGLPEDALILLAVANHRPQKRLELLPAIVAELRSRGRDAHLVLVGEPVRKDPEALAVAESVRAASERHGVDGAIHLLGSQDDLRPFYAAADVVVSTSAFEGLSLVHLEAIDAGRQLVTTAVSGAEELARKHSSVHTVAVDATPSDIAVAVLAAMAAPAGTGLAPDFSAKKMAARHADLLARAIVEAKAAKPERRGLVLVTNNFSTGGAQSSARRLLSMLAASGRKVAACVIEEQRDFPTKGRAELERAGIPVFAAPRAGAVDPLVTARAVAAFVDLRAPEAVLFWNVIPEHKVLVADLLLDVPIWDVSPGEMYFASLARYFENPRVGSPYLAPADYARRLQGVIVKYEAERARAAETLKPEVFVVPNGVDVPERLARRSESKGRVVIGTLARLSPDKKLEELIDAVRHIVDDLDATGLELRIAGAAERGSEEYELGLVARARGLPIVFCGERDASSFLAELDLFAMISEPSGCPNASLEAMAAGLPVVATDAGGARDQIAEGVTGLVVQRGDSRALGEAIFTLVRDSERRTAMSAAAHARARELFDVRRMAEGYARICLDRSRGLRGSGSSAAAE
ncbi:glycosyltransferase [Labilithrix luteola]|uniref:glycosyltransferase n=1 Tax=Labilithrix luteola TaxID=1391654 RepID=UPI0011BAB927|nr:glycosyltransferase [Labilithrix luteola]